MKLITKHSTELLLHAARRGATTDALTELLNCGCCHIPPTYLVLIFQILKGNLCNYNDKNYNKFSYLRKRIILEDGYTKKFSF